ncbi:hypothetical protein BpHYR1_019691 [Brachionus plicatilis]|uniref:Uncharacterized protein n=1 Tax=Brachionus plicatilis TaxID=10195 RepID=A0A3M7PMG6_BRAPC|nr:hypothetical protein BpHYR1_019691 [Brachionus plicatilis]
MYKLVLFCTFENNMSYIAKISPNTSKINYTLTIAHFQCIFKIFLLFKKDKIIKYTDLFISHIKVMTYTNFYQYLLHQDQSKEFFSKSGYINRPHRSRLTARNLEATTLLLLLFSK